MIESDLWVSVIHTHCVCTYQGKNPVKDRENNRTCKFSEFLLINYIFVSFFINSHFFRDAIANIF